MADTRPACEIAAQIVESAQHGVDKPSTAVDVCAKVRDLASRIVNAPPAEPQATNPGKPRTKLALDTLARNVRRVLAFEGLLPHVPAPADASHEERERLHEEAWQNLGAKGRNTTRAVAVTVVGDLTRAGEMEVEFEDNQVDLGDANFVFSAEDESDDQEGRPALSNADPYVQGLALPSFLAPDACTIEQIAVVAHDAHVAYSQSIGEIGRPTWADPRSEENGDRKIALHLIEGISRGEIRGPEQVHDAWRKFVASALGVTAADPIAQGLGLSFEELEQRQTVKALITWAIANAMLGRIVPPSPVDPVPVPPPNPA